MGGAYEDASHVQKMIPRLGDGNDSYLIDANHLKSLVQKMIPRLGDGNIQRVIDFIKDIFVQKMIPRLGDGNTLTALKISNAILSLENDSPSRGRKPLYLIRLWYSTSVQKMIPRLGDGNDTVENRAKLTEMLVQKMIPRLGDGNTYEDVYPRQCQEGRLENDSPSRGRKLNQKIRIDNIIFSVQKMIPRLGDGNFTPYLASFFNASLENDSPSRGRKPLDNPQGVSQTTPSLENDSPSRGRKLCEL